LDTRADWVERELPEHVDTYENAALLRTLDIDPAAATPAAGPPDDAAPHDPQS
jgi:hypothetical protein